MNDVYLHNSAVSRQQQLLAELFAAAVDVAATRVATSHNVANNFEHDKRRISLLLKANKSKSSCTFQLIAPAWPRESGPQTTMRLSSATALSLLLLLLLFVSGPGCLDM